VRKGTHHTVATKKKMSKSHTGRVLSLAHRQKISAARQEQPPPNLKHGKRSGTAVATQSLQKQLDRLMALLQVPRTVQADFLDGYLQSIENTGNKNSHISTKRQKISQNGQNGSQPTVNTGVKPKHIDQTRISLLKLINYRLKSYKAYKLKLTDVWSICLEKWGLDFSLTELAERQAAKVQQVKEDIASSNPMIKFKWDRSILKLAALYEDVIRKQQNGKSIKLFNKFRPARQQRVFFQLVKLKVVLDAMGIKTDTDKKMYLQGVMEAKRMSKSGLGHIPLKVLCIPLCVLDFLFYFRDYWYPRFIAHPDKEEEAKQFYHGQDYYTELVNDSLSFCSFLIGRAAGLSKIKEVPGITRCQLEIPMSFNAMPMCTAYSWGSKYIQKFRKLGMLPSDWNEFSVDLDQLDVDARQDGKLMKALQFIKATTAQMWADSGIPDEDTQTDIKHLLYVTGRHCPEHVETIKKQWH
jgi:hypothetical protein